MNLQRLASMLECPVCFGTLSNPRMMVCGHTLCHGCVLRLVEGHKKKKSVKCPTCRKVTKIEKNVSDLPKPFVVKDVQETIHGLLKDRTLQKQKDNATCPSPMRCSATSSTAPARCRYTSICSTNSTFYHFENSSIDINL